METAESRLAALVESLRELPTMPPVERAKAARALTDVAKGVLSRVGDEAIVEALDGRTYAQVAELLGVAPVSVNKAMTRHRQRRDQ